VDGEDRSRCRLFKVSLVVACAFWMLDAAADAIVFYPEQSWPSHLWPADTKVLWTRLLVAIVLVAFGLRANAVVSGRKRDSRKLLLGRRIFERSSDGIVVTDPESRIVDVNAAFEELSGYRREELLGRSPSIFHSERHDEEFYRRIWDCVARSGHWDGEFWDRRKNGEIHPKWVSIDTVFDDAGRVVNYFAVVKDITKLKAQHEELVSLAYRDPLTHLPNRRLLDDRLGQALNIAERRGTAIAVLFIDLDGFKRINDTLGHRAGDELLLAAAERIRALTRSADTLARLSGDEFVVMLTDIRKEGAEALVAEKLCGALSRPFRFEGQDWFVGASIGIARYPHDADCASELLRRADAAMYRVKRNGRGHYRYYGEAAGNSRAENGGGAS
jgi:diguanylate cyclase (GGDEF)-like protein/PAS domain S-box-containing protein